MPRVNRPPARRGWPCWALAPAALLGPSLAVAQALPVPPIAQLAPVVVTAARTPQPIATLTADVTVVDEDAIAGLGTRSFAELLQGQPGVEIVQNGGPGTTSGVFLRGANRGQTLLLLDGLRISSSTVGAPTLEAIPLDQAERIEILRGPASSLYGADAIGGVIQVFTRRPAAGVSGRLSGGYGTAGSGAIAGGVSLGTGPVAASLSAGHRRSRGFNATTDPESFVWNPDVDGYDMNDVGASANFAFAPEQELTARYLRSDLDAQFDAGPGFDDRTRTTLEAWQVASRNRLAEGWTSRLSVGETSDDSVSSTAFGEFPFRTRDRQYGWQNEIAIPGGAATVAFERREERIDEEAGYAVTRRDTNAVVGVLMLERGGHALQANLRHDDSSQYGGQTTGAIAWGFRFAPSWRVTAGYGTAFKAPPFNDLYYPGFSNPDLEPETARNVEAGVHWAGQAGGWRANARAVGWYNKVDQLIVFQCDAQFNCAPQNVARATLAGVTLAGDAQWLGTSIRASVDLQNPEDDLTGHLLPRRARRHGSVSVAQALGPVRLTVEAIASSQRYDDAENTRRLGGYAIVNVSAEWPLGHGVTLFARGDNLFDKDYALAYGYATGGARAFVGVRWQP
jgi:vitamin B12 transporter